MRKNNPLLSRRIGLLVLLTLLCCRAQRLAAQQHGATPLSYLPYKEGGQPIVEVTINGKNHVRFLLDTGCSFSILSTELAQQLGLTGKRALNAEGKPFLLLDKPVQAVEGVDLKLGETPLVSVLLLLPRAQFSLFHDLSIDGIIGVDSLKGKTLFLDPQLHQVTLWTASLSEAQRKDLPFEKAYVCPVHIKEDSLLYLSAHLNAKIPVDLVLDTGTNDLMIPAAMAKQFGKIPADPRTKKEGLDTVFGKIEVGTLTIEQITFDTLSGSSLQLSNVPVNYPKKNIANYPVAHVGMGLIQYCYTLLDLVENKIYIRSLLGRQARMGLGLEVGISPQYKLMVTGIEKGSSAEAVGLVVGDEILKIDGKPLPSTREELVSEMKKKFLQPEGSQVKVTVQHMGEATTREVTLTFTKLP